LRGSFLEAELPAVESADCFAGSDEELSNDIKVLDREIRESGLCHLDALSGGILLTLGRLGLFTSTESMKAGWKSRVKHPGISTGSSASATAKQAGPSIPGRSSSRLECLPGLDTQRSDKQSLIRIDGLIRLSEPP